ncbi:MAG: hypothetical protein OEY05_05175 [Paracoccaceae bacterium]|nr:hypothetical protein [Paracoccaceae bacterium]
MNEIGRGKKAREFLIWLAGLESDIAALPEKFIYFPLHFQPEMTTAPQGGRYVDQALAIEQLTAKLPGDMKIVVKENPLQGSFLRSAEFVQRISRLANVVIVHPTMNTHLIEQKSCMIATVTGTAGWEAIRAEKPCLYFGYPWYRDCPGVEKFEDKTDLNQMLLNPPTTARTAQFIEQVVARAHEGVIYEAFLKDPGPEFAAQNEAHLTDLFTDLLLARQQTTFR